MNVRRRLAVLAATGGVLAGTAALAGPASAAAAAGTVHATVTASRVTPDLVISWCQMNPGDCQY
jgi:hypothetical protein